MKGMANEEYLAKLEEGVEAWNQWREENPLLQPDLKGANLNFTQLQGVHLDSAQLQGAYLNGAQLQGAHLESAQLQGALLWVAQLQGASLLGTQLQGVDLKGAFFDNTTSLSHVILGDEKYGVASLADVNWGGVNLAVVDWSSLKMLGDEYWARRPTDMYGMKNDKARRLEQYRIAVRANRQLAVVLRDQGLNEEADHFAYRAQLCQRFVWRRQRRPLKYILSWFLFLLAGYGYRPLRSLFWYLVVIVGFAIVYYTFGHVTPLEAFVLSLTSFHGRGFFPGTNITLSDPRVVLAAFEAVVGLFIEISFIATFTQRFFGR